MYETLSVILFISIISIFIVDYLPKRIKKILNNGSIYFVFGYCISFSFVILVDVLSINIHPVIIQPIKWIAGVSLLLLFPSMAIFMATEDTKK